MKVPPPSLLTWCFSNSLMVLTSTPQIDLLKFLKKIKIQQESDDCSSILCKFILFDGGILIVLLAIDMETKKFLNSTFNTSNMKVLKTFICLNLYMVFKNPECSTYTVSITHHNSVYLVILMVFILYKV